MVMLYATVEMAQNYRKEIVATHLAGHRPNPLRSLRYAFYSNERENLIGVRKGKHGKPVRQQEAELEKEFAYLVGTEMGNDPDWVI
ncbi:MAG TPA: hypothetical protein VN495_00575 [Candidatus Paceibacterota bacterium]|nr:hypothetical protein [Candidatus Paceibacterota bacterium]